MAETLRNRLAAAIDTPAGRCSHPGAESCDAWWRADAALAIFGQHLRDEAAELHRRAERQSSGARTLMYHDQARALERLADAITPQPQESTDG